MIWTSLLIVALYIVSATIVGFLFQIFLWIKERND